MGGETPTRRVILLGASNLTRSFATVVAAARRTWDEPVEIMAAMGHGRSYGQDSTVFGRKISGIFPCALWQDLQKRPPLPTAALVTDVGNDLLYGVPPDQNREMGRRMPRSTGRRRRDDGRHATCRSASVERLSEARFRFFRRLLFPRSTLTLSDCEGARAHG